MAARSEVADDRRQLPAARRSAPCSSQRMVFDVEVVITYGLLSSSVVENVWIGKQRSAPWQYT